MDKLNLICVDDQREVLSAVLQDLQSLSQWLNIEDCESADEVLELMDELDAEGEMIALIISDHVMPGKTGVELLTEISKDSRFIHTRKVLLTGQATHTDTINAINSAPSCVPSVSFETTSMSDGSTLLLTLFFALRFAAFAFTFSNATERLSSSVIFSRSFRSATN